jgi:hypothetical protein
MYKMSASFLFAQGVDIIDSQKYLGTGADFALSTLGVGAVSATSTLTAYQAVPQGMYSLNASANLAGAGAAVDQLKYQLWLNNASNIFENTLASTIMNTSGNRLTFSSPVFIETQGLPTVSTVVAYQTANGALNPGASGNLSFSLTRIC